jgi:hypothetical protein
MKRIVALFALIAGLLLAAPAQAQQDCRQTAVYDASTNGSTALVTGRTTANIRICGFNIWAAGTATVKLVYGTGTACATGETAITPAYSLTTQTGIADSATYWRGMFVPAGNDLCIKTSAGVAVQAQIYFRQ